MDGPEMHVISRVDAGSGKVVWVTGLFHGPKETRNEDSLKKPRFNRGFSCE